MKKEHLSLIAVKTLLAVIIFAGVGTIIIGGGLLVGMQKEISEPAKLSQKQPGKIVEEEIKDEIKYVCEQETSQNKDGCYIRNARIIALTDYNKAKIICSLTSESRKYDCGLQILAVADIDRLKTKCGDVIDKIKKEQCYSILILKISETDPDEAIKLCETKSLSEDGCYAIVAEKMSFTRSAEVYNKALMICDEIKQRELKESCRENCKWNYEYEQE